MTVRMRHTRAHTANRRSHHALKAETLSACENCNSAHIKHRACPNCGMYRGRKVVDTTKKIEKKQKKAEAKAK